MEAQHVQAHNPAADHRRLGAARPIGQRLLIRPVRPEDDSELLRLHETLEIDDRYWRFFSARHPPLEFFTDLTTVHERGGARLVAVLHDRPSADGRIIGEAGYDLLPNGDGELEITVERGAGAGSRRTCWRHSSNSPPSQVCRTWRPTCSPSTHRCWH